MCIYMCVCNTVNILAMWVQACECHVLDSKSQHSGLHAVMGLVGFLKMSMLTCLRRCHTIKAACGVPGQ